MCGIVGALAPDPVDLDWVARMRDEVAHRGPDHAGIWRGEDGRICLGHRRLAIIDLDVEANQPFHSHDGRFVLTFNGEIYNYRSLRAELQRDGAVIRTKSDTEVLLEAFRRWGERSLERLSGMFAFAIWDRESRRLFCARDRAGEKPFYYAVSGGAFIFGSELKALTAWPRFERRLHHPGVIDFLTLGFVADPKTIWEGCYKLPAAHAMWVDWRPDGPPVVEAPRSYWDLTFDPDTTRADWSDQIRAALTGAAQEMAVSDVPLGTFLSGGVDSSAVTAALSRAGIPPRTFTIGFAEAGYDERPYARAVAQRYQTLHTERVVDAGDVGSVLQKLIWHYDEPFNDYSYLPTFYLCREARRQITVALSGDGGDELFAGYGKYQRLRIRQTAGRLLPAWAGRLTAAAADRVLAADSRARRTVAHYGRDARAALADMLMLGFTPSALRAAARGPLAEALRHYDPRDTVEHHLRQAPPERVGLVDAMRYLDLKLTLGGGILVKVDRASMAVALEVRPVLLHRDVMLLAGRIPAHRLAHFRSSKVALKDAMRPWLPSEILDRPKMGFAMPLGRWLTSPTDRLFGAAPPKARTTELLEPELMGRLQDRHARGVTDHTARIHSLVLLERWLNLWDG
jgi:asparagine synthase (glutamine-hydrolysing)